MIRPCISAEVTDLASAKAYIEGLVAAGLSYHFDDAPEEVINGRTGESIFTEDEWPVLRDRVAKLRTFNYGEHDCLFGYLIYCENHAQGAR